MCECSWRTEVEAQKVTDNQRGEQRNGQFTLDVVDVGVVVSCTSVQVLQDFYIIFVLVCNIVVVFFTR